MLAFAAAITKPEQYASCALPGIRRSAEPDSVFLDGPATGTIFESYNAILDRAAALDDLEALILVHQDAELDTPGFPAIVRAAAEQLLAHGIQRMTVPGVAAAAGVAKTTV